MPYEIVKSPSNGWFNVSHLAQAVVPEDVGEVPSFADNLLSGSAHVGQEAEPKLGLRRTVHDSMSFRAIVLRLSVAM